jgi:hypothetical protein
MRAVLYLALLNSQWLHILWITDEIVVETIASASLFSWIGAVAWVAILIDYLEVPVIVDTLRRVFAKRQAIVGRLRRRFGALRAPTGAGYDISEARLTALDAAVTIGTGAAGCPNGRSCRPRMRLTRESLQRDEGALPQGTDSRRPASPAGMFGGARRPEGEAW